MTLQPLLTAFRFQGAFEDARELCSGNINRTYRLAFADGALRREYILQRINTHVFREPQRVMENIVRVTEHMRKALIARGEDPARRVLEVIPTREGGLLHRDGEGGCWRAYTCITDAVAHDTVDAHAFYEVGYGFGAFQQLLADFPAGQLYESIPGFHDTEKRFAQLDAAIGADPCRRAGEVQAEIDALMARRSRLCSIVRLTAQGTLPLRVTHNDTKSNNVMLDSATGKALCVIDLDTVMPGSALYDYGDAIRFGGSTAAEDEADTGKIALDMEKTEAFTRGFLEMTRAALTGEELARLPLGIHVMTGELAVRFLTDYIKGDVYFKTADPAHNLRRARAQIALLEDVERKWDALAHMADNLGGGRA